jgi:hypothetical protein
MLTLIIKKKWQYSWKTFCSKHDPFAPVHTWPVYYDMPRHYNRDCTLSDRWWWEYPSSPSPIWSSFQLCRICTLAPTPRTMSGLGQVQGRTASSAVDQVTGWRRRCMWVTHSSSRHEFLRLSFFLSFFFLCLPLYFFLSSFFLLFFLSENSVHKIYLLLRLQI